MVLEAACKRGWIDRGGRATDPMRGMRFGDGAPEYVGFLAEVLGSPEVEALRGDPQLLEAVTAVCGPGMAPIGADVCRITFPGEAHGTPAHQDGWYCKAPGLWIAWIPLVDCSRELGALEVAAPKPELADHDATGLIDVPDRGWRTMNCVPGDVLLFSGLTPHRSLPNRSADRPRLSLDLRFALEAP
nr:phytanoyl-CoA dioxygenase family protein [Roseibium sp. CAU 1639]